MTATAIRWTETKIRTVALGQIAELKIGRTPSRGHGPYWSRSDVPWVSIGDMANAHLSVTKEQISQLALAQCFGGQLVPPGTLLLSFKLTIGRVAILDVPAVHNEAIVSIFPDHSMVERDYLFYALQHLDLAAETDTYMKGKTLNKTKLLNVAVPLPPLGEQRRIARVFSTIDTDRAAQQSQIAALYRVLTALRREVPADASDIPLRRITLKTLQVDPRRQPEESIRYIDVSAIDRNLLRVVSHASLLGREAPSRARKLVQAGDTILATIRPSLTRIAKIPEALNGAIASTAFAVLRPNPDVLDADYLYCAVTSPDFISRLAELQRGSSYPAVSDGDVLAQTIPLPPLDEQRRLASIMGAVRSAISAGNEKLSAVAYTFNAALDSLIRTSA